MTAHPDAPRIIQANDVAAIVIQQATEHAPGLFVTLDFRYGIADALWAAGYRKDAEVERLTAQLQAAQARVDEAEAQLAFIAAGCVNATREELVKRITAVGAERYKAGNWLAEHDKQVAAKALTDAADEMRHILRFRTLGGPSGEWLRARAASIEQTEADAQIALDLETAWVTLDGTVVRKLDVAHEIRAQFANPSTTPKETR